MNDPSILPPRVLELLGSVTGHELTLEVESAQLIHGDDHHAEHRANAQIVHRAASMLRIENGEWQGPAVLAARQAGLRAARFTVDTAQELLRLASIDSPAFTRVGERWLVLLGSRSGVLRLVLVDELGEEKLRMRPRELVDWLNAHRVAWPMSWLAIEPRMMLAHLSHAPSERGRLLRSFAIERREILVVIVYAIALAGASLAVPIVAQALVTSIQATAMIQPIIVLSVMLFVTLTVVAVLRVLQLVVVERIHRRLWVRGSTDWIRRMPRTSRENRQLASNRELAHRFLDLAILQKDYAALLLDGTSLALVTVASLVLLAFYHPVLLAFDIVLLIGLVVVHLTGFGAEKLAIHESDTKWALFAWMHDVAISRVTFASPGGRALGDVRGELLLRNWVRARGRYFDVLLRQVIAGQGLEVLATVAVLGIGGSLVVSQELTFGQLTAASILVAQVGSGVGRLGRQLEPVWEGVAAVETLAKGLDAKLEPNGGEILPRGPQPIAVELQDAVTDEVVLLLDPGARLGLHGASDSHARLLDLLYGLFGRTRLSTLEAYIDGYDVNQVELESLRDQVALVRGNEIVTASVIENLFGAGWTGDRSELHTLLALVDLHDTIRRLPDGFDQELVPDYDDGPLTESEVRRLVLVRALLAHPRLLLIDLGLDRLGLDAEQRRALLDWIFDRSRPWTIIVVTDSIDSQDVLSRCDLQREFPVV